MALDPSRRESEKVRGAGAHTQPRKSLGPKFERELKLQPTQRAEASCKSAWRLDLREFQECKLKWRLDWLELLVFTKTNVEAAPLSSSDNEEGALSQCPIDVK